MRARASCLQAVRSTPGQAALMCFHNEYCTAFCQAGAGTGHLERDPVPSCLLQMPVEMADKPQDRSLADRLLAIAEAEHQSGSPVAGQGAADRRETVEVAIRRWHSFSRRSRHPERATQADRVEDLAKGLRDRFEITPALTGPLMEDYRDLAAKLAAVLTDPPSD